MNQLRYVACHILKAKESSGENKNEEYRRAKNHCERAIYDATEAGILHCLGEVRNFKYDYQRIVVSDTLPDYISMCQRIAGASRFLSTVTSDNGDHRNNRGDKYKESDTIFDELRNIVKRLDCARPELNKKIRNRRTIWLITLVTTIVSVVTLIVAILSLLYQCNSNSTADQQAILKIKHRNEMPKTPSSQRTEPNIKNVSSE